MNFKVLGAVGLLVWAKKAGRIESLKDQLDALRYHGNFRFGQEIYEMALLEVGEI